MIKLSFTLLILLITMSLSAQETADELPFRSIPDYPAKYTPATTVSRMIDALGFRYYWATEGLRQEDLDYQPSEAARTTDATIDHIFSLCQATFRTVTKVDEDKYQLSGLTFEDKRRITLQLLKLASDHLRANPGIDMDSLTIKLGSTEYPFWNVINGQISDALWHVGQVVTFRRSSGNPINPNVSVFSGVLIER